MSNKVPSILVSLKENWGSLEAIHSSKLRKLVISKRWNVCYPTETIHNICCSFKQHLISFNKMPMRK